MTAKSIAHFDGNKYVPAKSVTRELQITTKGDTRTPELSPKDFGWDEWPAGHIWYDTQIAKQGHKEGCGGYRGREASESFRLWMPPAPRSRRSSRV